MGEEQEPFEVRPTARGVEAVPAPERGPGDPLVHVRRPAIFSRWDELTYLHWPVDPSVVRAMLPPGVEVDTHDGVAWVGLVPFTIEVFTPGGLVGSRFPETNVRTYVRGPDGVPSVWFHSLDASRPDAVAFARVVQRLPYVPAAMAVRRVGDEVRYRSERRWPWRRAGTHVRVRVGERIAPDEVSPLEHFLTARWSLLSTAGDRLRRGWVDHEPWPLHRAELLHLEDELVEAEGYPAPVGPPLVHFSPGVNVRISGLEDVPR